jgi:hypothetical protein
MTDVTTASSEAWLEAASDVCVDCGFFEVFEVLANVRTGLLDVRVRLTVEIWSVVIVVSIIVVLVIIGFE